MDSWARLLGLPSDADLVTELLGPFDHLDVYESPPNQVYFSVPHRGVSILAQDLIFISVQFFTKSLAEFSAFLEALPYGLSSQMTPDDLRLLFGDPATDEAGIFIYPSVEDGVKLVVDFDANKAMKLVSLVSSHWPLG